MPVYGIWVYILERDPFGLSSHGPRAFIKRDNGKIPLLRVIYVLILGIANTYKGRSFDCSREVLIYILSIYIYITLVRVYSIIVVFCVYMNAFYLRPPIVGNLGGNPFTSAPKNFIASKQFTVVARETKIREFVQRV